VAAGDQAGHLGLGSPEAVQSVAQLDAADQRAVGKPLPLGPIAVFADHCEVQQEHTTEAHGGGELGEHAD
jgi:hypothetical protein